MVDVGPRAARHLPFAGGKGEASFLASLGMTTLRYLNLAKLVRERGVLATKGQLSLPRFARNDNAALFEPGKVGPRKRSTRHKRGSYRCLASLGMTTLSYLNLAKLVRDGGVLAEKGAAIAASLRSE